MNTRQPIGNLPGPVSLCVSFNQDNSCFAVGLESGFCIYDTAPCEMRVSRDFNAGVSKAEMLGRANYMALVGGGKQPKFPQNKVIIWDDNKSKAAITLEFRSPVLRVRLIRTRIVVALKNSVHVYTFSTSPERLSIYETADNPFGLCCLGERYIAFPGRTPGQVQIVEVDTKNVSIVLAHANPLRMLELSRDGELLATASTTGTLIRLFSTSSCARITELRRGMDPAKIFSLAISPSNTMLAVTSDKSTLHVFDLPTRQQGPSKARQSIDESTGDPKRGWGFLSKLPLLPRAFSDTYSFASAHFESGSDERISNSSAESEEVVKGLIGWLDDDKLVLVGAGQDARWEKFALGATETGQRICIREGWKRYLGSY